MRPNVTVLMAVYNGERYLRRAVDSILRQTYEEFEFLIIDDASTDCTAEILSSIRDPRIKVLRNDKNIRLGASLNRGLEEAKGEFIVRQDADDISLPTRMERQCGFMFSNPGIGVLGSQMKVIDSEEKEVGNYRVPLTHGGICWGLFFGYSFGHPAVIMRRSLVLSVDGYKHTGSEDYDLWTRLVPKTRFANLAESFVLYRRHPDAAFYTQADHHRRYQREALREYLRSSCGVEVTEDDLNFVARAKAGERLPEEELDRVMTIMIETYRRFRDRQSLSPVEEMEVRQDLTAWLKSISRNGLISRPADSALRRAARRIKRMVVS